MGKTIFLGLSALVLAFLSGAWVLGIFKPATSASNLAVPSEGSISTAEEGEETPGQRKPGEDKPVTPGAKVVQVGPHVFLEIEPNRRAVVVTAKVVRRAGFLELLLCREKSKEHESILSTPANAKDIHQALLAAGFKPGSPVRFVPSFQPATGQTLDVRLRYKDEKGKDQTVDAKEWIRKSMTKNHLEADWVFGGSKLVPNWQDEKLPPHFLANDGDYISISNFESSLIDVSIEVSEANNELNFEPWTEKVPALGTPVAVILTAKPTK